MNWQSTLYMIPGILLGLTIHEYCHALCAWKLGDSTARDQGRITLNPLKHIDPLGFLFIIIVGFGWAKPVQFNPGNLSNFRRDRALIAAAGPLSNLVLGVLLVLVVRAMLHFQVDIGGHTGTLFAVLYRGAFINFVLFVFNLFPIPPLDGSHIAFSGLNLKPEIEDRIRPFGMPALIGILIVQRFVDITILPIGRIAWTIFEFFMLAGAAA